MQGVVEMFAFAIGSFGDLGLSGLAAIAAVTLFVLFAFWVGTLGFSTAPEPVQSTSTPIGAECPPRITGRF